MLRNALKKHVSTCRSRNEGCVWVRSALARWHGAEIARLLLGQGMVLPGSTAGRTPRPTETFSNYKSAACHKQTPSYFQPQPAPWQQGLAPPVRAQEGLAPAEPPDQTPSA